MAKTLFWPEQAEMIKRTAKPPKARKRAIEDATLSQARLQDDPTAQAFGVSVSPKMMQASHPQAEGGGQIDELNPPFPPVPGPPHPPWLPDLPSPLPCHCRTVKFIGCL